MEDIRRGIGETHSVIHKEVLQEALTTVNGQVHKKTVASVWESYMTMSLHNPQNSGAQVRLLAVHSKENYLTLLTPVEYCFWISS